MRAELLMVGTELLLGETTDTNATYLARCLADLGIDLHYKSTVGDNWVRMTGALATALERSQIVIVSGGLGPTQDDLTREVVAAATGRTLVFDERAWEEITRLLRGRGRPITENNRRQAMLPAGAVRIPNPVGVAPGIWLDLNPRLVICLPGVPDELRAMMQETVMPRLRARTGASPLYSRVLRFRGIGESALETELMDLIERQSTPTIALYAGSGEVRIRLTCRAGSAEEAERLFAPVEQEIQKRVGDKLYASGTEPIEALVAKALTVQKATVAVAESCTGGLLGERLTSVPGASAYFLGGVLAYANDVKERLLGVDKETLKSHGAVSAEVALQMADGVRRTLGADWGLGITGIAGPGGGTETKPVGTVFIACASARGNRVVHHRFGSSRDMIRRRAALEALHLLYQALRDFDPA